MQITSISFTPDTTFSPLWLVKKKINIRFWTSNCENGIQWHFTFSERCKLFSKNWERMTWFRNLLSYWVSWPIKKENTRLTFLLNFGSQTFLSTCLPFLCAIVISSQRKNQIRIYQKTLSSKWQERSIDYKVLDYLERFSRVKSVAGFFLLGA